MMKWMFSLWWLLLAAFNLPATAQEITALNAKVPIEITADSLEVLQEQSKAIFAGAVEAKQGNITLKAARMVVLYRSGNTQASAASSAMAKGISRLEVEGNVSLQTPNESARSERGVYNVDSGTVTLLGDVRLMRGQNMLRGGRLDYNLTTQKSLLSAANNKQNNGSGAAPSGNGRVKGIFVPRGK